MEAAHAAEQRFHATCSKVDMTHHYTAEIAMWVCVYRRTYPHAHA